MKKIIEKQRFYISEFEEEAAWLSFMHREGWKLVSAEGSRYEFEACEKEDYVYQLDFKEAADKDEDYIQMFQDYGWEYVQNKRCWYYFRKRKGGEQESNSPELSIFSDSQSKIEMCRRIINGRFLSILPMYLVLLGYSYITFFTDVFTAGGFWNGLIMGMAMGTLLVTMFGFGIYINQVSRLQKKMKSLQ